MNKRGLKYLALKWTGAYRCAILEVNLLLLGVWNIESIVIVKMNDVVRRWSFAFASSHSHSHCNAWSSGQRQIRVWPLASFRGSEEFRQRVKSREHKMRGAKVEQGEKAERVEIPAEHEAPWSTSIGVEYTSEKFLVQR